MYYRHVTTRCIAWIAMLLLLSHFVACWGGPTGRYYNTSFSSDVIEIQKISGTEYRLIRGHRLPGSGELREPQVTTVRIEGTVMNYEGINYEAFSDRYNTLTFLLGTYRKE